MDRHENIFATNITKSTDNDIIDGQIFVCAEITDEQDQIIKAHNEQVDQMFETALQEPLSLPMRILQWITGIRRIDKCVRLAQWNKDTAYNKGEYRPYKIRQDDNVNYLISSYYALDILHDGEGFELLFPCYELETMEKLTGKKAPQTT